MQHPVILTLPALLAVLGLVAPAEGAQPGPAATYWKPTSAQIQELEARLPKPPPDGVQAAARYYFGTTDNGKRMIVGEILAKGHERAGIYLRRDFPMIMDGGCGVITLSYLVDTKTFAGYACNGQA